MPGSWDGTFGLSVGSAPARARMVTTTQSQPPGTGPPPSGSGTGAYGGKAGTRPRATGRTLRLTGRGTVLVVLGLCALGVYLSQVSHWNPAAGAAYVAGCVLASWYVRPGHLLVAVVTPPLLFGIAVIAIKAATSSGAVLTATTEGTLLTLASSAPWLFAGTVVALLITVARGLGRDIRDLRAGIRGDHGLR